MDTDSFNKTPPAKVYRYILFAVLLFLTIGAYLLVLDINRDAKQQESPAEGVIDSFATNKGVPRVVIFGDSRTGHDMHRKVVDIIYSLNPVAVFHVGDAVEDGNQVAQWQIFNDVESKLIDNYNFYIAAGNHDEESNLYYDNFSLPGNEKWYSVNYLGIHWVVLNSNLDLMPGSQQYQWLEDDLAKVREKINYTAIVMHQSLVTSARHSQDNVLYKEPLTELFGEYSVDVVFAGHDHTYERSLKDGIYYLICGSVGAPLYDQEYPNEFSQKFVKSYNYCTVENDGEMSINAFDDNSIEIDQISIVKD